MTQSPFSLFLADDAATTALGAALAKRAGPGTVILLAGPIGAGKTHLSRAFIRARMGEDIDVPSPTFTLVQTYEDAAGDVWHADLYRLGHTDEVIELGLEAAFDSAICLVEWPDRLGPLIPTGALHLALAPEGEGRRLMATPADHPLLRGLDPA